MFLKNDTLLFPEWPAKIKFVPSWSNLLNGVKIWIFLLTLFRLELGLTNPCFKLILGISSIAIYSINLSFLIMLYCFSCVFLFVLKKYSMLIFSILFILLLLYKL